MEQPRLESERLLLRPLTLQDAPQIQSMASDKRIAEMTANIPHPYPETGAIDWISEHRSKWQQREQASFGVILKSSQLIVGCIGLLMVNSREAGLGYWVGLDYWGNGYATEATKRIIKFGLNDMGLNKILASRLSRNPASGNVLLKAGFEHIGTSEGNCGSKFESLDFYEIYAEP